MRQFADAVGATLDPRFNLVVGFKLDEEHFRLIKDAVLRYIVACFSASEASPASEASLSEDAIMERLERDINALANRTPNGILMPKREFTHEFNEVHRTVAEWFRSLEVDEIVYRLFCPVTIRAVTGTLDPQAALRPYASNKPHVDLWTGDPADNVSLIIPVLGDIEHTSVDFLHPPDDFESRYMRVMKNHEEGQEAAERSTPYPIRLELGHAYAYDAVVLHKTTRAPGGKVRVALQLLIRRPLSAADRLEVERISGSGRTKADMYVEPADWYAYGTTKFMQFNESYGGDHSQRIQDKPLFEVVSRLS